MSKVLVIPDIHGRNFWREPIKHIDEFDKVVFLGDYLDPYPYEYEENPDSMEEDIVQMLQDIITLKKENPDKIVLLTGNHVDHYMWGDMVESSRYNRLNAKVYRDILLENIDLFQIVYIDESTIFSHAGITEDWARNFLFDWMECEESALEDNLVEEVARVLQDMPLKNINNSYISPAFSMIGPARGGWNSCGSCEWADVSEHFTRKLSGFSPKSYNMFQIFGHTQLKDNPVIQDTWACLDCRKAFIVDTNTHEIKEYV